MPAVYSCVPWARVLDWKKGKDRLSTGIYLSLLPDWGGDVTSLFKLVLPPLYCQNGIYHQSVRQIKTSLKFPLSRYFITVMRKITNTIEILLPDPLSNKVRKQTGVCSHWWVDTLSDVSLCIHGCKHLAGLELILTSPSSEGITQAILDNLLLQLWESVLYCTTPITEYCSPVGTPVSELLKHISRDFHI